MSAVSRFLDPVLVERLGQLQLSARRVVEGTTTGRHRSPVKGASVEFRQHRFYVPGDEPKRLDWRVLGRTDRPYVKEYDEETNLRALVLLDTSGSMAYSGLRAQGSGLRGRSSGHRRGSKFEYAASVVGALAYLMLGQTESVGLGAFAERVGEYVAPHGGTAQLTRILEALERCVPRGGSEPGRAMGEAAERLGRRGLVVVVSDLLAPAAVVRRGLARLRHDGHEVIVLRVLDPDEIEFPFDTWARFRGFEAEASRVCEPAMVRKIYLENFERHRRELEEGARKLRVELHEFRTDKSVADAVVDFLKRREGGG